MRTRAVLPVLFLLTLAGCGGGDKKSATPADESPTKAAENALVGTWDVTSVVDRTNLTGKGNTKGSKDKLALVISCLDDDCAQLVSRGSLVSGALSRTITLTAEDDSANGERTRNGPCNQTPNKDKPGRYTEVASYTWSVDGDDLSGGVDYSFKGCGFDGTSHLEVTGTRTDEAPTYLSSDDAEALAGPVTSYDEAVGTLYADFNACYGKPVAKTSSCVAGLLEPWSGTFAGLTGALDALDEPTATCQKAIDATDLAGLEKQVASTTAGLKKSGAAQQKALDKAVPALITTVTTTHQDLVTALMLCVDPTDTDALGKNGTLSIDVDKRLPLTS